MMDDMSGQDWARLAEAVKGRRLAQQMTQGDVQQAGGPSTAKLREIENGRTTTFSASKRRDLERALNWVAGSVDRVLAGEDPMPLREGVREFEWSTIPTKHSLALRSTYRSLRRLRSRIERGASHAEILESLYPIEAILVLALALDEREGGDRELTGEELAVLRSAATEGFDAGLPPDSRRKEVRTRRSGIPAGDPDAYDNAIGEESDPEGPEGGV